MNDLIRVVLFGSYYRGFYVLHELLSGPLSDRIKIVGVATDDPDNTFISRSRRVWQYAHTIDERNMVRALAQTHGIPVYQDRVKTPEFHKIFRENWRPHLCIMATFGQLIDEALFTHPVHGFYNLHPYDGGEWPSVYAGGNPFNAMMRDGLQSCVLGMHAVDSTFDTGELIANSSRIAIPPGASVTDMHKITGPIAALLIRREVARIIASQQAGRSSEVA
jgi:methionyl-tRNA formyltransferase